MATTGFGGRRGTDRWVLVAGGLVIVVLMVILFAGSAAAPRVLGWGLGATRDRVLAALPAGTTPAERQQVRRAFGCVIQRAEAGAVDETALGSLSRTCNAALADRRLEGDELREIRALLAGLCPDGGQR